MESVWLYDYIRPLTAKKMSNDTGIIPDWAMMAEKAADEADQVEAAIAVVEAFKVAEEAEKIERARMIWDAVNNGLLARSAANQMLESR